MNNPFDTPNPFETAPFSAAAAMSPAHAAAWVSVAPIAPAAPLNMAPNTAVDLGTGEIIFEDDNETPYDKNNLLSDWRKSKEALDKAKQREADLRGKVVACYSNPAKEAGTENIPLGNDWFIKVAKVQNYSLKSFDESVSKQDAVTGALNRMSKATVDSQGNELNPALGAVVAYRLVKWEPELSKKEYDALLPGHKEIIDTVLEIKPGSPTVTLVPPKEKK